MRLGIFAVLASAALLLGGCGEKDSPKAPPKVETDTPDVDIDVGGGGAEDGNGGDKSQ
jgi:hypothetical protein